MIYWRFMEKNKKKAEQTAFVQNLLLDALKQEYGIKELPEIKRTELGKPFFPKYPQICFNYSHSKNAAVCVLSTQEVGIDLEQIRSYSEKTARRFCGKAEWNWLQEQKDPDLSWIRIWTLKEAWLKYRGIGIRTDLQSVDVSDTLKYNEYDRKTSVVENGQRHDVFLCSFLVEDFWISVCGTEKQNNHVLHI